MKKRRKLFFANNMNSSWSKYLRGTSICNWVGLIGANSKIRLNFSLFSNFCPPKWKFSNNEICSLFIYLFDILLLNFEVLGIFALNERAKIENLKGKLWDPVTPLRERKLKNPEISFSQIFLRKVLSTF